jgi:heat shock protein HslJ
MKLSNFLKPVFYFISISALLTIAACDCDDATLVTTTWVLTDYGPKNATVPVLDPAPPPGTGEITLSFSGINVNGKDGCNFYFSVYSQNGCAFSVGNINTTLIACSPEIMTQASTYLDILKAVGTFRTSNNKLKLCTGDDRVLIFRKQ